MRPWLQRLGALLDAISGRLVRALLVIDNWLHRWYVAVIVFLLFIAASFVITDMRRAPDYAGAYVPAARGILDGSGPGSFVPPLFPAVIALVYFIFGVGVVKPVVFAVGAIYFWGCWYFYIRLRKTLAEPYEKAALVVVPGVLLLFPPYLALAGTLLSEALFLGLSLVAFALIIAAMRENSTRRLLLGSVFLGIANYARAVWFLFPLFYLLWNLLLRKPAQLKQSLLMLLVMAAMQVPVVAMNYYYTGNARLVQSRVGLNLMYGSFPPLVRDAGTIDLFTPNKDAIIASWSQSEQARWTHLNSVHGDELTAAMVRDLLDHPMEYAAMVPGKLSKLLLSAPGEALTEGRGGLWAGAWQFMRALHLVMLSLFFLAVWKSRLRDPLVAFVFAAFVFTVAQVLPIVSIPRYVMPVAPLAYWVGVRFFLSRRA